MSKYLTAAAVLALTIGTAHATLVTGSFEGQLNDDPSSNFTSDGFTSSALDAISGQFSFDTTDITGTFTATIMDITSGDAFTLPAGFSSPASANVTATDYTVSAVDALEFLPTFTPFTATLSLDLTGTGLVPGDLGQTALFAAGIGSLELNIPTAPGGPVDQTIGFTLSSASVPEPASMTLLGFGLASLAGIRRRRARR